MTLIDLVGEQPIPNLLVDRQLKPENTILVCTNRTRKIAENLKSMIREAEIHETSPYDLVRLKKEMATMMTGKRDVAVNLTGGTKIMALAGYHQALEIGLPAFYLQSENKKNVLYTFRQQDCDLQCIDKVVLPELITLHEYLVAHWPDGYIEKGPSTEAGGVFERTVAETLRTAGYEVLCGVVPREMNDQLEIDLLFRAGNNVGVAELKIMYGADHERPKKGIDQLSTISSPIFLGTYTHKFLITAGYLPRQFDTLTDNKNICVVELKDYKIGKPLSDSSETILLNAVKKELGA